MTPAVTSRAPSEAATGFRLTLVGFSMGESLQLRNALGRNRAMPPFDVNVVPNLAGVGFPASAVHAVVFTPSSLAYAPAEDLGALRNAMGPGTCRVYLAAFSGAVPDPVPVDDFIQRTTAHDPESIAQLITRFFEEADQLNRESTPRALRDLACLGAYRILAICWPLSYLFGALHVGNAVSLLSGGDPWPSFLTSERVLPVATGLGAFLIFHVSFVIVRNLAFGLRVAGGGSLGFVLPAVGLAAAAGLTAYSMFRLNNENWYIGASLLCAAAVYQFYLYARRIRAECTSLTQIRETVSDEAKRTKFLTGIGLQPFGSGMFPFLPSGSRSIFISYMHGSEWSTQTAGLICDCLRQRGTRVYIDSSSISSGSLWRQSLLRAMSECGTFIAVLDGKAPPTHWVLAESAYAATLRKAIGKPRIILVTPDQEGLDAVKAGPFGLLYRDIFALRPEHCPGAAVVQAGRTKPSPESVVKATDQLAPVSLLGPKRDGGFQTDMTLADRAWRTALLMSKLLEDDGSPRESVELLSRQCRAWLETGTSLQRAIALNFFRSMLKSGRLLLDSELTRLVSGAMAKDASFAVKLAATDFLGAARADPELLSALPAGEIDRLREFRSVLMKTMNRSQRAYALQDLKVDVARELGGQSPREALSNVLGRIR